VADLVTHMATAFLVKAVTRRGHTATLVLGAVLPDLVARAPGLVFARLREFGAPIPETFVHAPQVAHMPLGMLALGTLIALLFHEQDRLEAWKNLMGGLLLHLALDVCQDHMGVGYMLFYPFSTWDFELRWFGSEATVLWAPWLAPLSVWAWWSRRIGGTRTGET
jgi:hypothetical protein